MDDDFTAIGGYAGATIAFSVTVVTMGAVIVASGRGGNLSEMVFGLACLTLIPTSLGYFAGKEGARSKTVPMAFVKGAVFFGCAMAVCGTGYFFLLAAEPISPRQVCLAPIIVSVLVINTASLVSGMAAIYVRDFRQFKRFPIVPQFTLQELMIVTTLVGVVLSAIASMACLRASG
jgi:hypothetical protein